MTIRRRIKTGRLNAVLQDGKYFIPINGQEFSAQQEDSFEEKNRSDFSIASGAKEGDRGSVQNTSGMTLIKGHPQPHYYDKNYGQLQESPREVSGGAKDSRFGGDKYSTGEQNRPNQVNGRVSAPNIGHQLSSNNEYSNIPETLWKPLSQASVSVVDTKALLAYCEATVKKSHELERKAVDRFKSKIESLEAMLLSKDVEIKSLRQQIEDMQLLVKVIERRK